jgi:hypothetical protein
MSEHEDPVVARYLRTLQEPAPSAGLWKRIDTRRRQRRMRRIVAVAAAASLAGFVALGALLSGPVAPPSAVPSEEVAVNTDVEPAGLADVRALDRQLQAAYERGANEATVQPLWEARNRAVAELATTSDAGPSISVL